MLLLPLGLSNNKDISKQPAILSNNGRHIHHVWCLLQDEREALPGFEKKGAKEDREVVWH